MIGGITKDKDALKEIYCACIRHVVHHNIYQVVFTPSAPLFLCLIQYVLPKSRDLKDFMKLLHTT